MTMSPPLQQTDLFGMVLDFPISSSAAHRARTSAAPTPKAKASTESVQASTSKPSASSTNADLVGSLLKIALISELEAQTGLSMHWRQSATPAGHSWLVLETSVPTTNASEAGLSGSIFHTPTTKANFAALSMQKWKSCGPWRALLATPRKTDADRGGRGDVLSQLRGYPSKHAGMPRYLPTPVANDGKLEPWSEAYARRRSPKLDALMDGAMRLETLPTPTKRDKRMDGWSPAYDKRKSPTMDAVMDGAMTGRASDKWAGARALAQLLQSHGLTGTAALPITYGWMMGYPAGWLSRALRLAVQGGRLQLALSSKRSATPSARKSPKPSAEPL